jgi:hypothetical protein
LFWCDKKTEQRAAAKERDKEIAAVKEGLLRQINELTAVISEQERELSRRSGF